MTFSKCRLSGILEIVSEAFTDQRGGFLRTYCQKEFQSNGIDCDFVQDNLSWNPHPNTIRGLHFQEKPAQEVKLVRCVAGAVFDVVVDVRPDSDTFLQWEGIELSGERGNALLIPQGFAHGYQTLLPDSILCYKVSQSYCPERERGLRYNDPSLGIVWRELTDDILCSEKDRSWPLIHREEH